MNEDEIKLRREIELLVIGDDAESSDSAPVLSRRRNSTTSATTPAKKSKSTTHDTTTATVGGLQYKTPPSSRQFAVLSTADSPPSPCISLSPPTPPRTLSGLILPRSNSISPESLAGRRAVSGRLPSRCLKELSEMRLDASKGGEGNGFEGLGVDGPASAGLDSPGGGMTRTFRLGSTMDSYQISKKLDYTDQQESIMELENILPGSFNSPAAAISPLPELIPGSSPNISTSIRRSNNTNNNNENGSPLNSPTPSRRRIGLGFPRNSPESKGSPSLRNSKLFDKLVPSLSSSFVASSSSSFGSPPSPIITRSSAYTYSPSNNNNGPLTPLTPSHLPGAPTLTQVAEFQWNNYSPAASPPKSKAMSGQDSSIFDTGLGFMSLASSSSPPPPAALGMMESSSSPTRRRLLVGSPLAEMREGPMVVNPFFVPV